MPGDQDIFSLGLNIESFNEQKKLVLKEYIALFDQLAKYDGKIFNPVMGDGLTKFNTSIAETSRLVDELNAKLQSLNSTKLGTQALNPKPVKEFADETRNAAAATQNFGVQASVASFKVGDIGRNLTHMLTQLRYIAYILPGIGIAGIFNLAFQAIGDAAEAIGLFSNEESKTIEKSTQLNNALATQLKAFQELSKIIDEYTEKYAYFNKQSSEGVFTGRGVTADQAGHLTDLLTAGGYDRRTILSGSINAGKQRLKDLYSSDDFSQIESQRINFIAGQVDYKISQIKLMEADIKRYTEASITGKGLSAEEKNKIGLFGGPKTTAENLAKSRQADLDVVKQQYKEYNDELETYYTVKNSIEKHQQELQKFNDDQARKEFIEKAKEEISVSIAKQKDILDNDKKFHDDKKQAILTEYEDQVKLNKLNRQVITGLNNDNVSTTPEEKRIAERKEDDENAKALIKRNTDLEKNDVQFYQRKINATTQTNKDELEEDALKNERIFQNEEKSLSVRLEAYKQYILDKQKIRDYDYGLEIQKGAARAGGVAALTPEEKKQIETHNNVEKANIAANGEKQVYDIVYTSLNKIIKDVEDSIKTEEDMSKEAYINALENLNQQYEKKKISLHKYNDEKKKIENKYQKQELDDEIKKDEKDLEQFQKTKREKIDTEVKFRLEMLNIAKAGGDQNEINKASGAYNASIDAQTNIDKDIAGGKAKLQSDRLKRAKIGYDDDEKKRKQWVEAALKVEEKLNEAIRKIYDQRIEFDIQLLEKRKAILDQQFQNEENAVEKSSLNQKDKQALEIQLAAEKQELDRRTAAEEKDLRIKEFNFNKKLQLANAAVNIAAAIIKDGLTTPKSIADAVIGAIEVATILAEDPPSFAGGIKGFKGGFARYGEAGAEEIRRPGKKPFIALTETISYLEPGTDIIPLGNNHPEFRNKKYDPSWDQTRYLAKQIKNNKQEIKNIFKPTIIVDMNFESRRRQILGN